MEYSVIITHYKRERNLRNTLRGLMAQTVLPREVIIVEMGGGLSFSPMCPFEIAVVAMDGDWRFLPLAEARNMGAANSLTPNLVFLDVDCIPAPDFCEKVVGLGADHHALVMGSPRYLLAKGDAALSAKRLRERSVFHPSRPLVTGYREESCYELFWSLCFAVPKGRFREIGGFDGYYAGYGAEDTDFALKAEKEGVPFYLSDAEVFHQQHPIYVPPLNHLASIVRNSNHFRDKWGYWPMADCLRDFADMGHIDWNPSKDEGIRILSRPSRSEIRKRRVRNAPYR